MNGSRTGKEFLPNKLKNIKKIYIRVFNANNRLNCKYISGIFKYVTSKPQTIKTSN